ncbi:MAG: xylan 1,4-beta-xylosidase [Nocardioidaceae bacterium]|jgi:xylan 1,4-beta-xylosidase|nr:xylan 1,4-beta-xylosidase [Nocardioidaceae bacterium]
MTQKLEEQHVDERQAREDWERRIYRRLTDTSAASEEFALPAPRSLTAVAAVGHVRLSWDQVDGAAGYLIERIGADGERRLVQHGGSDVPAVPGTTFADTGLADGASFLYRVGAVAGADYPVWEWSDEVSASTVTGDPGPVTVEVDAGAAVGMLDRVWRMVGSERLTQLRFGDDGHGHHIGEEFAEALTRAHRDLGVTHVRAHAILHDDNHVVTRADDGTLSFDFTEIDRLYDQILDIGVRPVVELSFMPAAIARDPEETVFVYRGIISPPREWGEWREVVGELTRHLVDRYGIDEVAEWSFEVWNEPNLEVFWTGTQDDYLRLYDEAAHAVKTVDTRLLVGGPATAASEWIEALATHAEKEAVPFDFATSHTYGNLPIDTRPALGRHGYGDIPVWWTEWGVGSTHFGEIHDGVSGAPFMLSGYAAVQGRLDALAYWVISDHFEELGRPPALFHNGFGLLTVGNLRKPRYWAVHLAAAQGDQVLACTLDGDGAGVLVQAWATRHEDGTVDVLLWNGTVNSEVMHGDPRLSRRVSLTVDGLAAASYGVSLARVDAEHSNILAGYPTGVDWPDPELKRRLQDADRLHEEELPDLTPRQGSAAFDIALPQPGVARIRVVPKAEATHPTGTPAGTHSSHVSTADIDTVDTEK